MRPHPPSGRGTLRARAARMVAAAALLAGAATGRAAEGGAPVEIAPYAGFLWGTTIQTQAGPISTSVAADVGATLGFRLEPDRGPGPERTGQLELLYVYGQPAASFQPSLAGAPTLSRFSIRYQYFQAGGLAGFPQEGYEPFVSASLGALWISPCGVTAADGSPVQVGDGWAFAATLGGGVKWYLSQAVGLRLGARLMVPVFFQSAAFFSGPGGAALVVSAGIPQVHGDFTLGLILGP